MLEVGDHELLRVAGQAEVPGDAGGEDQQPLRGEVHEQLVRADVVRGPEPASQQLGGPLELEIVRDVEGLDAAQLPGADHLA